MWVFAVCLWVVLTLVLLSLYVIFFVQWLGVIGLLVALGVPPIFVVFPFVYWVVGGVSVPVVFCMWLPFWIGGVLVLLCETQNDSNELP